MIDITMDDIAENVVDNEKDEQYLFNYVINRYEKNL